MLRFLLVFLLGLPTTILSAQDKSLVGFSIKIFPDGHYFSSEFGEKRISKETPTIEISQELQKEFLDVKRDYYGVNFGSSNPSKRAATQLSTSSRSIGTSGDKTMIEDVIVNVSLTPVDGEYVMLSFKILKTTTITDKSDETKESVFIDDPVEVLNKPIRLGVITIVDIREKPQSGGEPKQTSAIAVLVTEDGIPKKK